MGVADELFVPAATGSARPDPRVLSSAPVTRFAPAPTGFLHLGHLVNALYTWGIARATGGRVILRIEDHDRQRSRPEFESALLEDLERLGLVPDEPPIGAFRAGATPYRQSRPMPSTRRLSSGCARMGSSTRAPARGRRSPPTRRSAGDRGVGSGARVGAGR